MSETTGKTTATPTPDTAAEEKVTITQSELKELKRNALKAELELKKANGTIAAQAKDIEKLQIENGVLLSSVRELQESVANTETTNDNSAAHAELQEQIKTITEKLEKASEANNHLRKEIASMQTRSTQQIAREKQDTIRKIAKDLVSIIDTFNYAAKAAEQIKWKHKKDAEAANTIIEGIRGVESKFLEELAKHGVEKMAINVGDKADPNAHSVVAAVPVKGHEKGHIVEVSQNGYWIKQGENKQVLREAKVLVAQ